MCQDRIRLLVTSDRLYMTLGPISMLFLLKQKMFCKGICKFSYVGTSLKVQSSHSGDISCIYSMH